ESSHHQPADRGPGAARGVRQGRRHPAGAGRGGRRPRRGVVDRRRGDPGLRHRSLPQLRVRDRRPGRRAGAREPDLDLRPHLLRRPDAGPGDGPLPGARPVAGGAAARRARRRPGRRVHHLLELGRQRLDRRAGPAGQGARPPAGRGDL
ncbi:MAG: hypothetical protein AVDCRST_MAG48-3145, partial [uncultured Friedmanniella sp.]